MMVVLPSSPVWYQSRGIDTSHNGILAFASRNLVFLIDLVKKRPEIYGILNGHADKVTTCSFCPNLGHEGLLRVASGAEDCTIKVWDAQQKLLLQEHSAHGANKIVSVHWNPVNSALILSGDEKGFVVCWNLEKDTTDRFYPDGTSQMQLSCLTCSPHHGNLVAIGYKSGAVSIMDLNRSGTVIKKLRGHANEIHAVVWTPTPGESILESSKDPSSSQEPDHLPNGLIEESEPSGIIATGSKDKTIKLWSVSKGKCVRTFKIPTRPSKGRRVNEDSARLYVTVHWPQNSKTRFYSSGYNGDIISWNLAPDAENLFEVLASQSHDVGHQRIVFNISNGSHSTNTIVSTSMDRQLLYWTIPQDSVSGCAGPDWSLPTLGGFVYSIAVSPKDPSVIAIGVGDGMIRVWKTRNPRAAYDITTLWQGIKEKVMALAWHPSKDGCLAFATEDGKVGIYDTLSMRPPVIAETYHLKPVYALSWGPRCFQKSTEGEIDSTKVGKRYPNLFSCGGDGVILQHDPQNMSKDAVNIDIVISQLNSSHTPGRHSEVSWNKDGRLVAIGNDHGIINIYLAPHLLHIIEIKSHSKIVNCVRWKPAVDEEECPLQIASGSNNTVLYVHDLRNIFSENKYTVGNHLDTPILVSKPYRSLVGHLCRITSVSYNPRNPAQIVSSSYDGTAQVWDTDSEQPLYNFRGHHGRLMCVAWSSVVAEVNSDRLKESGMIYSGADDYTVHGWFAEDQQHKEPMKSLQEFGFGPKNKFQNKKKGRNKKSTQKQISDNQEATRSGSNSNQNFLDSDLNDLLEKRKLELLAMTNDQPKGSMVNSNHLSLPNGVPTLPSARNAVSESLSSQLAFNSAIPKKQRSPVARIDGSGDWRNYTEEEYTGGKRKKRLKNMFMQSITLDNRKKSAQHQDCIRIAQWKMQEEEDKQCDLPFTPGEGSNIHLGFYTDRIAAFRMMKNEAKKIQEDEYLEGNYNLRIWMGDVVGAIEEATERCQLSDHLVSMAPMAGQAFWRKTAYAFAKQLINEDHHQHAVHYMLACDKVHEAIQVLLDNRHYREAVALARARLCDDDPVLRKTVQSWAYKLKNGGSAELAAKCFASIDEFRDSATCLAQRASSGVSTIMDNDVSSLWAAASLCRTVKDHEFAKGFANRALNTVCLRTWNWADTNGILSSFSNLRPYVFILMTHEILTTRLISDELISQYQTVKKSLWNVPVRSSAGNRLQTFPCALLDAWKTASNQSSSSNSTDVFDLDAESCLEIHREAVEHHNQVDNLNEWRILYQVVLNICGAIVTSPNSYHKTRKDCPESNSGVVEGQIHVSTEDKTINSDAMEIEESGWINHLIHALTATLHSRDAKNQRADEILQVVCEIIVWVDDDTSEGQDMSSNAKSCEEIVKSLKTLCLDEMGGEESTLQQRESSKSLNFDQIKRQIVCRGVNFLLRKISSEENSLLFQYLINHVEMQT